MLKVMRTKITTLLSILLLFTSCGDFNNRVMSDPKGIKAIQEIIKEKFDSEVEVYKFTLSASTLKSNMSSIVRVYKTQEVYFSDIYDVHDDLFSDPSKYNGMPVGSSKIYPFKIGVLDLSTIPDKYQEALTILDEKGLLVEGKAYPINNWSFMSDSKGNICSNFTLNRMVGSSKHGRRRTTTYDSYSFNVDASNNVSFIN